VAALDPEIDRVEQNDRSTAICAQLDRSTRLSPNLSTQLDSAQLGPTVIDSIDFGRLSGAVLGKSIWGAWPSIIWKATTAKRNYYRTNYINQKQNYCVGVQLSGQY